MSLQVRCVLVLVVALLPAAARAQITHNTGSIYGNVSDAAQVPLPGVMVTLEGEGSGSRVVYTGDMGAYRFTALLPGKYAITFSLQGFTEVKEEEIPVSTGDSVNLDVILREAFQETIVVKAETSLVDTKKTGTWTVFDETHLNSVPNARDPWSILDQVPGIDVNRVNVGGTASGQQALFIARGGSFSQNIYSYDGINITDPVARGATPAYFDFGSFEEIQVTTGGGDPSIATGGVVLNFVTKRAGNRWSGQGSVFFTDHHLQGDNVDDELRAQNFLSPTKIDNLYEYGGDLGGPIIKDKLWIWGAYRIQRISNISTAFLAPNGTIAGSDPVLFDLSHYNLKLNFSANMNNETNFQFFRDRKQRTNLFFTWPSQLSPEAALYQDGSGGNYKVEHAWTPNSSWFVDIKLAYLNGPFSFFPNAGIGPDAQPVQRINDDFWWENGSFWANIRRPQYNVNVDTNAFAPNRLGDHEFKFGFAYKFTSAQSSSQYGGDVFLYDFVGQRGDPSLGEGVARLRYEWHPRHVVESLGIYAGDTWRLNRVTLNLGLRFNTQSVYNHASTAPANSLLPDLLPALSFPGSDPVRFTNVSPRLGATWDASGSGKTIIRGNYARFYDSIDSFYSLFVNPIGQFYPYTGLYTYYADLNGDGTITRDEVFPEYYVGPFGGLVPGDADATVSGFSNHRVLDPDLESQTTDEFLVGIEREFVKDLSVAITYTHRKYDRIQDTYIPGIASLDYHCAPLTVTNPETGETFETTECLLSEEILDKDQLILLNTNGRTRTYDGLELTLNKRMSHGWMVRASGTLQTQRLHFADNSTTFGGSYQDPTNVQNTGGRFYADDFTSNLGSEWSFKISSVHQLPKDFTAGVYFKINNGHVVPLRQKGFLFENRYAEGSHSRLVAPIDELRTDAVYYLDLQVEKQVSLGKVGSLRAVLSVFNVFNSNTVLEIDGRVDTRQFLQPQSIIDPRVFRIGLNFSF